MPQIFVRADRCCQGLPSVALGPHRISGPGPDAPLVVRDAPMTDVMITVDVASVSTHDLRFLLSFDAL
jgi:hypothetical protein